MDSGIVATVGSIIAGFGVTVLMFRLERELSISDKNWEKREKRTDPDDTSGDTPTWIPPADYLVILAVVVALLFGVLPLLRVTEQRDNLVSGAAAACAAATVLLAGYVPAILAHYRFICGLHKRRSPILWSELVFVALTVVGAIFAYLWVLGNVP